MRSLKVYIADDHTLFRKAMVNLLKTFQRITTVMDAENGRELLNLIKSQEPDVAIVDLQMPVMDGAETCQAIINRHPDVKIIVLTMHDSGKIILHMMDMGVHAFLLKNTEPHEFEKAIYAVAHVGARPGEQERGRAPDAPRPSGDDGALAPQIDEPAHGVPAASASYTP
jgi:DNA-binding NarL/FixJ family response regulator